MQFLNPLRYTESMSVNLPLHEMTLQEKLVLMELLWEDLARTPEVIESPTWHKTTLEARHQRLTQGKSSFQDWETAKVSIRNKLS